MPYSPMGTQSLGFAPLQPFRTYQWHTYVHPGDGHQPMLGMHQVHLLLLNCPPVIPTIWWGIQLWGLAQSYPIPPPSLHDGDGSSFPIWYHPMTELTMNLWWALNLVILLWWLGIRLMSSLPPHLQSSLLLIHTFILGSLVIYHHLPTFHLNQSVRIIHSIPNCCRLWTGLGFHPH